MVLHPKISQTTNYLSPTENTKPVIDGHDDCLVVKREGSAVIEISRTMNERASMYKEHCRQLSVCIVDYGAGAPQVNKKTVLNKGGNNNTMLLPCQVEFRWTIRERRDPDPKALHLVTIPYGWRAWRIILLGIAELAANAARFQRI